MLYDNYVEQVKKLACIKNKILKFKIPIIILFSMIFCFIAFVISTKGIITSDLELSPKYNYGEIIEPQSSALFSNVYYEYSVKGKNEWTRITPKVVGEYDIRVVSKKSFGRKGYSKVSTFVIEPINLDVYVNESIITYGDLPSVSGIGLINGDTISCSDFVYNDLTINSTTVIPNLDDIIIIDKNGQDVTSCYNIMLHESDIYFNQRSITVTISSDVKIYDGYELKNNEYEITSGSLANDDEIEIIIDSSITNVGSTDNIPSSITIYNNGNIVTENYDVNVKKGVLNVNKRDLTITTNDQTYTYDGNKKSSLYTCEGLISSHHIEVIEKTEKINVGTYSNIVKIKVLDDKGLDVSDNYNLIYIYGTLTINQRLIEVVMEDEQKIYDGISLTSNKYHLVDEGALINGHIINVTGTGIQTNVGTSINNANISIINENEEDVTKNYNVVVSNSKLNILARPIKLEIQEASKIYDGKELETTYDIVVNEDYFDLVENHELSVFLATKIKDRNIEEKALEAGSYICYFRTFKIRYNNQDVTSNYKVETNKALLVVEKRYLEINMNNISKVYDSKELYTDSFDIIEGSLVDGETLFAKSLSICNVEESSFFTQKDVTYSIKNDYNIEVTSNYEIVINEFTLTILKRKIKINLNPYEVIYNDEIIDFKEYSLQIDEEYFDIVQGHKLEINTKTYQDNNQVDAINVGTYINKITDYYITYDEKNLTNNYSVEVEDSYISILHREIIIGPYDEVWEYDGCCHSYDLEKLEQTDLDHSIVYSNWFSCKYVGIYDNTVDIQISKQGIDVTSNYDIIYSIGTLEITQRLITISTDNLTKEYDGYELKNVNKEYSIKDKVNLDTKSLGQNDELIIDEETFTSIINVWQTGTLNKFEFKIYNSEDNQDVTSNYNITHEWGILEITLRHITIFTNDLSKLYDDIELKNIDKEFSLTHECCYEENKKCYEILGYQDEIIIDEDTITSIINVWQTGTLNKFEFYIKSSIYKQDVTLNYDITYNWGILEITARPINIDLKNEDWEYDGCYHSYDLEKLEQTDLGHSIVYSNWTEVKYVGKYDNDVTINIFKENYGDVTSNYDITCNFGKLEITPRTITISTNNLSKVYDGYELKNINKEYSLTHKCSYEENKKCDEILGYQDEIIIDEDTITSITYCDELDELNKFEFYIYSNEDEKDVTSNYVITYDWGKLKIEIRQFTISLVNKEKTYDKTPLYTSEWTEDINSYDLSDNEELNIFGLAKTDSLFVKSNSITYVKESNTFNQDDVVYYITHSNGKDTLSNYEFKINDFSLTIFKRNLIIKPKDEIKIYDGKELIAKNWIYVNDTSLPDGDYLNVSYTGSIINVGEVESSISINDIYDDNATSSLEDNYNITLLNGTLKITPRPIQIILEDFEATYNDNIITCSKYNLSTSSSYLSLVEGQTLTIQTMTYQDNNPVDAINVGTYINKVQSTKIVTKDNQDVTSNYEIDAIDSKIIINPRKITVGPYNEIWEYDGKYHSYDKDTILSTDLGHAITYRDWILVKDVGKYDNDVKIIILKSTEDVTSNYDITYSGTLEITKRIMVISTDNLTKEYDGTILTNSDKKYYLSKELGTNDELVIDESTITAIKYVKESGNLNKFDFSIYNKEEDVTSNYDFSYEWGTLTITAREVTVNIESYEWVYDSLVHSHKVYELIRNDLSSALVVDDKDEIIGYSFIQNVGETVNTIDIKIKSENNEDHSDNYKLSYNTGILKVLPCDLTIKPKESYIEYDGKSHNIAEYEALNLGINDSLEISTSLTKTYVSDNEKYGNENSIIEYSILRDKEDVSGNYNITLEKSIFEIIKREITIAPMDKEIIYDGKSHSVTDYIVKIGSIVDGEILKVETLLTKTYVSDNEKYGNENSITEYHFYKDGQDVTSNYDVTTVTGLFKIISRTIEIKPDDAQKEYDGEPLTSTKAIVTSGYILTGDVIQDIESLCITYVNESTTENVAKLESIVILNSKDEDVTSSYAITLGKGNLTINPCTVFVETGSASKTYDGEELTNSNFENPTLYSNDILENAKTTGSIIKPGEVENSFEADVYNSKGDNITNCYIFKGTGVLTIFAADEDDTEDRPDNDNNLNMEDPIPVFDVISSVAGAQYLKLASYVKYNGTDRFTGNVTYPGLTNEMTLISSELNDKGIAYNTLEILDYSYNLSPYYTLTSSASENGRIYKFYKYSYSSNPHLETNITDDYTNFVYNNYLDIDSYTKEEMLNVWSKHYTNDSYSVYDTIFNVKKLVQNYTSYNLDYDKGLDESGNCAVYFFNGNNGKGASSALCRHYSTAAVMMLRALDIPARYTVGYLTDDLIPNSKTTVYNNQGHAWVEVFIDGIGWINLEVTGSSGGNDNNGNNNGNNNFNDESIVLSIKEVYAQYSGQARYLDLDNEIFISYNSNYGPYTFKVDHVLYDDCPINVGTYKVSFDDEIENGIYKYIHIYDKEGVDVTAQVMSRINLSDEEGKIIIYQSLLTITSKSDDKPYDGTLLQCPYYDVDGELNDNHTLEVFNFAGILTPDSVENTFDYIIKDNAGNDVTSNYKINSIYGTLTINRIQLKITSESAEKTYDGKSLHNKEYEIEGSILENHTIKLVLFTSITYPFENCKNTLLFKIYANDLDVTDSLYEIEYDYGTLTINSINLEVQTNSESRIYDGNEWYNSTYSIIDGSLLSTDTLEVTKYTSICDVGNSDNKLEFSITNNEGIDLIEKSCYSIIVIPGKLEVNPACITITSSSKNKVYDTYELTQNSGTYKITSDITMAFDIIIDYNCSGSITNPGTVKNTFNPIIKSSDGKDITNNFEITEIEGNLTVTATITNIDLYFKDYAKVYSAKEVSYLNLIKGYNTIDESKYSYKITYQKELLDEEGNYNLIDECIKPGTYRISPSIKIYFIDDSKTKDDYVDVTDILFTVTESSGKLTITKRTIEVTTGSLSCEYDGKEHYNHTYNISSTYKLVSGHTLSCDWLTTLVNITSQPIENEIDNIKIYDSNGIDVTDCYDITVINGTIEIYV